MVNQKIPLLLILREGKIETLEEYSFESQLGRSDIGTECKVLRQAR